jgi:multidrug efflux pump subunit AcrB
MQHRGATLAGAAVLFAASLALLPVIGFSLFPKSGTPQFIIKLEAPEGAGIAATDRIAQQVEEALRATPEIDWWFTNVGHGNPFIYYNVSPANQKPNIGEIYAQVKPEFASDTRTPVILARLRQKLAGIAGAEILVREFEQGPPIEAHIAVCRACCAARPARRTSRIPSARAAPICVSASTVPPPRSSACPMPRSTAPSASRSPA